MKRLYTAVKLSILCLCTCALLQSCVKDNRDDCPDGQPSVRIVVRTLAEATRADADHYNIDNVYIYIFDGVQRFVGTWHGDAYTFGTTYEARLNLDPGIYQFVVWTNQGGTYTGAAQSVADELVVSLAYPAGGTVTEEIPDLHHGMLSGAEVLPDTEHTFEVVIRPNTYRVNFTVEGLDGQGDTYAFSVRDDNTHYAFDNTIIEGMDQVEYLRTAVLGDQRLTASLKTLRLTADRSPVFTLTNLTADKNIHTDDLVRMIVQAYASVGHAVDFEEEFEFDLKLVFDTEMGLTVTVDGWDYNPGPTPLG